MSRSPVNLVFDSNGELDSLTPVSTLTAPNLLTAMNHQRLKRMDSSSQLVFDSKSESGQLGF